MTTQLDCSIGLKKETVYGTAVVVDQFVEFLTESLDRKPDFIQGKGLRVGARVARADRRSLGKELAEGSITVEAPIKGLGIFLNAAFGTVTSTAVPAQSGVFQQVHTPATTDPLSSYTLQKGIPPLGGGATTPLTFPGAMCSSFELSAKDGAIVEVTTDWTAREAQTAPAYAAPAYPTPLDVFTFVQGVIVIGGTVTPPTTTALASGGTAVANVSDFSLKWDNGLDDGGWNLGGAGKRSRKAVAGAAKLTGKMTAEYDSTVLRDAYLAQTDLALLLTFTHPSTIGASAHPVLQILIPVINLDGDLPSAAGGKVITQSADFTGLDNSVNPPITVVYVSTDTAV
jgi:hypothetical protein